MCGHGRKSIPIGVVYVLSERIVLESPPWPNSFVRVGRGTMPGYDMHIFLFLAIYLFISKLFYQVPNYHTICAQKFPCVCVCCFGVQEVSSSVLLEAKYRRYPFFLYMRQPMRRAGPRDVAKVQLPLVVAVYLFSHAKGLSLFSAACMQKSVVVLGGIVCNTGRLSRPRKPIILSPYPPVR